MPVKESVAEYMLPINFIQSMVACCSQVPVHPPTVQPHTHSKAIESQIQP